jgi:hypothetical protein
MGFAALYPSYGIFIRGRVNGIRQNDSGDLPDGRRPRHAVKPCAEKYSCLPKFGFGV